MSSKQLVKSKYRVIIKKLNNIIYFNYLYSLCIKEPFWKTMKIFKKIVSLKDMQPVLKDRILKSNKTIKLVYKNGLD